MSNKAANVKLVGNVIETRSAQIWLESDGIVRAVIRPSADELTLQDAIENIAAIKVVAGEMRRPVLSDIRQTVGASKAHRDHFSDEEASSIVLAGAVLISSPLSRMIGNFFMQVNSPPYSVRLFTSEEQALDWLRGFRV